MDKPELPEPEMMVCVRHTERGVTHSYWRDASQDYFTPAHMRAMFQAGREQGREESAQVCDDMVLYTGFDCAASIRALRG